MADFDITKYIAQFEGFGKPGTKATVNNNPGNLIAGPFSTANGAIGADGSFAVFPDAATGFNATNALVEKYALKGASVSDLINSWAPGNAPGNTPESTANYIDYVSKSIGASPNTKVSDTSKSSSSILTDILGAIIKPQLGDIVGTAGDIKSASGIASGAVSAVSFFSDPARLAAFVAGLICIAGAIYLFAPQYSSNVAASVTEGVKGVAMVAA